MKDADLERVLASLRDGDKVRARFDYQQVVDPFTVTFEGVVRIHENGARVGTRGLVNDSTLSSVKILERAARAFYRNQPASRQPGAGDFGKVGEYDVRYWLFNGAVWYGVNDLATRRSARGEVQRLTADERRAEADMDALIEATHECPPNGPCPWCLSLDPPIPTPKWVAAQDLYLIERLWAMPTAEPRRTT